MDTVSLGNERHIQEEYNTRRHIVTVESEISPSGYDPVMDAKKVRAETERRQIEKEKKVY